ncbi:MAG: glutaredoxin 3 [Bauldia sp.]
MTRQVVAYTKLGCPYCAAAKALLRQKGGSFTEIDITGKPELRTQMIARSSRYTVPQIFIGDTHVGGCDDLFALDAAGGLDELLGRIAVPA